jgi:hypothetical protein
LGDLKTSDYLDVQTLGVTPSGTVSLWVKTLNNSSYYYNEQNYEIDCEAKKIKSLTSVSYEADGNSINTAGEQEWQSVVPQSMGEVLYHGVCPS